MAIADIGQPSSGIVGISAIGFLIQALGWRQALFVMACVVGSGLLLVSLLILDRPRAGETEPVRSEPASQRTTFGTADQEHDWAARQLLSAPRFWQYSVASSMNIGTSASVMLWLVPYGQRWA